MRPIFQLAGILFLAAAFLAVHSLDAKPDRPTPKAEEVKPKPPPVPQLIKACQFGTIEQKGSAFTISGSDYWSADGVISADGKTAKINWFRLPEAQPAIGVYRIDEDGELRGHWQWETDVEFDAEGMVVNGNVEHLYGMK